MSKTSQVINLDEPLKRGETVIASVTIRKPNAGELRGVNLMELAQMDVGALEKVLPRITIQPTLTAAEVKQLSMADLMQFGVQVSSFLLTKQQKADSGFQEA